MQCPSCKKNQPMSFRCRFCGAELVRRTASAARRSPSGLRPMARPAPQAAAAAVALDNPYQAPIAAAPAPYRLTRAEAALASRGSRLSAALVDSLVAIALFVPMFLAVPSTSESDAASTAGGAGLVVLSLAGLLGLAVYQMILLSRQGQTIGKKALKIRIVRYDDGGNPGFGRAVGLRIFVNGLLGMLPAYGLVDVLFIFGSDRRCLHDYVAGTKVVEA